MIAVRSYTIDLRDELSSALERLDLLSDEQVKAAVDGLNDGDLFTSEQSVVGDTLRITLRASPRLQDAISGATMRKSLLSVRSEGMLP